MLNFIKITLKNIVRSLLGKDKIIKTGKAKLQICYITLPSEIHQVKVLNLNDFKSTMLTDGCFRVFGSDFIVFSENLKMKGEEIVEKLYNDRLYLAEEYFDPLNNQKFYGEYYKLW